MKRENIRALRVALGLSQAAFAYRIEVGPATVYRWESGKANPGRAARKKLDELAAEVVHGTGDEALIERIKAELRHFHGRGADPARVEILARRLLAIMRGEI